ncbi:unnamed protein product [Bursaphelenchus xylophilus]|uniref:acid phosphatase n=1 Tax=Bursaphelenchus xylophilus TaxID=6326 RepID=A0A1I7SCN9_BURXY|nr:unnamed protein product [Bursaphelenchus xylophilus]CAG9093774.1 unnamed protein product [Bursaphelenchus xylophilus]
MLLRLVATALVFQLANGFIDQFVHLPLIPVTKDVGEGKLVFLQAVWRHGDRTPLVSLRNDNNTWPGTRGELTTRGMSDQVVLGEKLRTRYIEKLRFLGKRYTSKEIHVRSTDVNRTLISAMANMIGFYKDAKADEDYPDHPLWPAGFVPVPVHTEDYAYDYVGNVDRHCPRTVALTKLLQTTPHYSNISESNKEFLDEISELSGIKLRIDNLFLVHDNLLITKRYNKPWPEGFTDEIYEKISSLKAEADKALFGVGYEEHEGVDLSLELAKIRGGPLLSHFVEQIQNKVLCATKPFKDQTAGEKRVCRWMKPLKYHAISAHDMTIAGLFAAFGFNQTNYHAPGLPDYASAVTVELREQNGTHHVKVLFWPPNNPFHYQDITAEVSDCDEKCDLEQFLKRSEPYKVEDAKELCDTLLFGASVRPTTSLLSLISLLFIVGVLFTM